MVTWIICGGIALYAAWIIRKRYIEIRAGKFCSCGCENCPSSCGKKRIDDGK